jgi:hypothetical protein
LAGKIHTTLNGGRSEAGALIDILDLCFSSVVQEHSGSALSDEICLPWHRGHQQAFHREEPLRSSFSISDQRKIVRKKVSCIENLHAARAVSPRMS